MVNVPSGAGISRPAIPLSDEELDELDEFLLSDATSDETMVLEILDGYLTAIVVGPVTVMPSLWLPRVWGPTEEDAPEFETMDQAQRIMGLILRHMNGIIGSLEHDAGAHEPLIGTRLDPVSQRECADGEMWAYGFMEGVALCPQDWAPLLNDSASSEAFRPIRLLGGEHLTEEEKALIQTPEQRGRLSEKIPDSLGAIHRFWLPYREAMREEPVVASASRARPKVGRNDLCPCGSGKKFKRCCGGIASAH
jgi:uncharacterized protein